MKRKETTYGRRGSAYISSCVLVLLMIAVVAVSFVYAGVFRIVATQTGEAKILLDGYITRYSVEKYGAIKRGDEYAAYTDDDELVAGAYEILGFGSAEYLNGEGYTMQRPVITPLEGKIGVEAKYDLIIPFFPSRENGGEAHVPCRIVSYMSRK